MKSQKLKDTTIIIVLVQVNSVHCLATLNIFMSQSFPSIQQNFNLLVAPQEKPVAHQRLENLSSLNLKYLFQI